ncbi:glucose 1-dehydrogenase [Acrocarpospora pleiomorpha]|nr:SDR family NAD(P)-dependent oxidoreductase [Acrocarpospora pleiomorpha]
MPGVGLVVGAASGMGQAVARRLASEGVHVVVSDLAEDGCEATVEGIRAAGGAASADPVDATDVEALRELMGRIEAAHGGLDFLHAHVGMPGPAGLEISEADWQKNVDVNMKSAFFACAYAMPLLRRSKAGSIVLTASTSAIVGSASSPLYSMTKGSLTSFARALAVHGANDGVRANVICPGPVETPMLPTFFSREDGADIGALMARTLAKVPLGRVAAPEEVAGVVAFLASSDASYVTGVTIPIDGGRTAA